MVRRCPVVQAINHAKRGAIIELPCRDPQAVIAAAASQIGKPYDYTAILGLGLRRDWQEEDAWFCSELVAWAFQHAGDPLFRADCLRRVTPQHLWMLAPAPPPPDPAFLTSTEGRLRAAFSLSGDLIDILPRLKAGDSHFNEASQCALTCTQDLQLLDGLTPPVRRPKHCARR